MILDDGGDLTALVHEKYPELLAGASRFLLFRVLHRARASTDSLRRALQASTASRRRPPPASTTSTSSTRRASSRSPPSTSTSASTAPSAAVGERELTLARPLEQLGHQVQVRQPLRLPRVARRRHQACYRRHARRQGRHRRRIRRRRQGRASSSPARTLPRQAAR